jgi:predicted nucleotidyltransferase
MNTNFPTSDSELNAILHEFTTRVQSILGNNFISAYLQGSFALGDWDNDSDVDFTIVIEREVSDKDLSALQAMHARIYTLESKWAKHLEGSYFPKEILRSNDPTKKKLWFLDNTFDHLVLSDHDNTLVVRWVVREYGITLAGIDSKELIDPVSPDDLKMEVSGIMQEWAKDIFAGQWEMNNRWAQPYVVLSYCRMLHTIYTGRISSKLSGATWAKSKLDSRWVGLIQRAWKERPNPSLKVRQIADPIEVNSTLEFIRHALELSQSDAS